MTSTGELKAKIRRIFERLTSLSALQPGEDADRLYSELEELVTHTNEEVADDILRDSSIRAIQPALRRLRAEYEYNREKYWSTRISLHPNPAIELMNYPDFERNEALAEFEFGYLNTPEERTIRRALFVGCGPLPITSIFLARKYGVIVDCIDIQEEAYDLARTLAKRLQLSHRLRFFHVDIFQLTALDGYDVIFIAALVGTSVEEKSRVMRHVSCRMRIGGTLIVRTGRALRTLFYSEVDLADLDGFVVCVAQKPPDNVIATAIIAEKTSGSV